METYLDSCIPALRDSMTGIQEARPPEIKYEQVVCTMVGDVLPLSGANQLCHSASTTAKLSNSDPARTTCDTLLPASISCAVGGRTQRPRSLLNGKEARNGS